MQVTLSPTVSYERLTWAIPPTIFSFTTTVSFSWSSKAAAFWAAFTRLSEALFTALPAACRGSEQQLLRTQGSSSDTAIMVTQPSISLPQHRTRKGGSLKEGLSGLGWPVFLPVQNCLDCIKGAELAPVDSTTPWAGDSGFCEEGKLDTSMQP